jgi:hypothetical protein
MKNKLPSRFKRLFSTAGDWIKGCQLFGGAVNLMHFGAGVINTARNAAKTKQDA